eukprot:scaffold65277_cov26-Cyclotella_meneghiniana.AAC.2
MDSHIRMPTLYRRTKLTIGIVGCTQCHHVTPIHYATPKFKSREMYPLGGLDMEYIHNRVRTSCEAMDEGSIRMYCIPTDMYE